MQPARSATRPRGRRTVKLPAPRRRRAETAIAAVTALAYAAAFWVPAYRRTRGMFPAPLDDVYIHFDFARAWANGHPMAWIAGQGPSSGETAPLYAALLAAGHAVGFRGASMGLFAAIVAVVGAAYLARGVGALVGGPVWLRAAAGAIVLSVGLVDWTLFSGMEVSLFCACLMGALASLSRLRGGSLRRRTTLEHAAWRLGAWGAALVWLRPEAAVIVVVLAIAAARGAGRRSGLLTMARVGAPGALATLTVLAANRLATGEAASAGAQLKLLTSLPFLDDSARARAVLSNVAHFLVRGVGGELSASRPLAWVVPALALVALASRRTRTLASTSLAAAIAFAMLVSLNSAAPYQNLRYYVPSLVLTLVASALGLAALARTRGGAKLAGACALAVLATTLPTVPRQAAHFARAASNIRDQQIAAGLRLTHLVAPGQRVLVGDAGAIAYVSGRGAIDALGLGGYGGLPFARAAVHGEAATLELIERIPEGERPTHLALHPSWFGEITSRFGRRLEVFSLDDNVICAGRDLAIYEADWSALGDGATRDDATDELDVADVVSEREHAYEAPLPWGGRTLVAVREIAGGRARFDGGRVIPAGSAERFTVLRAPSGGARVTVRTDGAPVEVTLARLGHADAARATTPVEDGAWRDLVFVLDELRAGDRLELRAAGGELHDFHVWISATRAGDAQPARDARNGG
jgi:hypothetical protein